MAIEETLDRLATNIALLTGAVATLAESVNGKYAGQPIYSGGGAPSSPPAPAAAATPPKRGRGRPVAGEAAPAAQTPAPAATAPAEPDPFDTDATAPTRVEVATLDEVRAAMKALAAATTQDNALKVLKEAGGVANLTELQRTPEKYGVVVKLAKAQMPAAAGAQPVAEADPFETAAPAAAPEQAAPSLEDLKKACVAAAKRTSQDTVTKVFMKHGGKSPAGGPSLIALPISAYAAVIKEVGELPTTKT